MSDDMDSFRAELETAVRQEYGNDELLTSPGAMRHFSRVVAAAWDVIERWVEPIPEEDE